MTATRRSDDRGFTIIEMLIAVAIMMTVTGAIFSLMDPSQGMFAAQPEQMDMQQRLRIGVDTLEKDLRMAGGGTYSGAMSGSLGGYFAPIMPFRIGNVSADPAGSFFTDRITVVYVPPTSAQTTISQSMPNVSAELKVNDVPGCPSGKQLCGFSEGMTVIIMDTSGFWDTFTITQVQDNAGHLQHNQDNLNKAYGAGAYITQVNQYTYWLKTDTVAQNYQLMRYDGASTDIPIADNVVGLSFEYYGDPNPPQLIPSASPPKSTYGPSPPVLGVDSGTNYGTSQNCAFTLSGGQQIPRLSWLGNGDGRLIKLDSSNLTDGPWCPDSSAPGKYDADLLRIRKVRVTLRVQAANKGVRGPAGNLFTRAGTSRSVYELVPDQEIKFDVTARNMNLGR